jgi:hypothetical protein
LTDSKRITHEYRFALLGSLKSLRYQPTPPCIEASDWSVAFHAFGTVVNDQPLVEVWRCHAWLRPWPLGSRRNSHWPPMR